MTLKAMLTMFLGLFAITTFGYWRYQVAGQSHGVAQFSLIQDPSDSIQADCGRMVGLAERALAMPETGEGSTITLFALGSRATANEPQLLGEFKVPVIRRVIEGQHAATRERQALFSDIRSKCGDVKETRISPIFQAVKRGVEHLSSIGAADDSRYLFIQTDGEETENLQIKAALNNISGRNSKLPSPIQNRGVHITFCGMAETVGEVAVSENKIQRKSPQRDSRRADRLHDVWAKMFTNPELVIFEPYCSKSAIPGEDSGNK